MLAALCAGLALAPAAAAHITVAPTRVDPGETIRFRLFVPGERFNVVTTGASLTLPPGTKLTGVEGVPGWRSASRGRTVSWSGGSLVTGQLETFSFCARMPQREGEVALRTSQRYSDGKVLSFPLLLLVARGSGEPAGSCKADGGLGTGLFLAIAGASLVGLAALLLGLGRWLRRPLQES
jgi:hypothetical protein